MDHFTAHRLVFVLEAHELIELNEHQGSALRGALFHALRNRFCTFAQDPEMQCARCSLALNCPIATLVSTLDPTHARGQDRPRPFTVQPPILSGDWRSRALGESGAAEREPRADQRPPFSGHYRERGDGTSTFHYEPGESLVFGLTLYAQAMQLFPYVVLALQEFEAGGLGRKCQQRDGRWRRGRLKVREIWAENPLTGERQAVLRADEKMVHVPDVPVTHAQILARAQALAAELASAAGPQRLTLHFLTPTRLVEAGQLLKPQSFRFRPFLQRLLERLEALSEAFCDTPLAVDFPALLHAADQVQVLEHTLTWEEVTSYSTRRHAESPIGGLVGRVTLAAEDWSPFLPWLLWGQLTHVGKDAVKGNGLFVVPGWT